VGVVDERGGDSPDEPRDRRGVADRSPAGSDRTGGRRRALAERFATELCDVPPAVWERQAFGSVSSHLAHVEDDPELAEVVADAWDVARSHPPHDQVQSRPGTAGRVVVAHGDTWTLVARSGGPVLVLSDRIKGVLRVDRDPHEWIVAELTELVTELINVSLGLPAYDESKIPPMPPLPWHRDR
jgi:hypothetical protein